MPICTLINISLDISTNIAWWVVTTSCKYTVYGTYYIITYIRPPKPTKEEIELMELKTELHQLNKKLYIMHNMHNIHNNANIITRNQLMLQNKPSEEFDDNLDLSIFDDFIIIDDN
jgi:hypothetical protein